MSEMQTLNKTMTMPELRIKAADLGVMAKKMKKAELIYAIQQAEGHTPCFGNSNGLCQYTECCFMKDCLKISA